VPKIEDETAIQSVLTRNRGPAGAKRLRTPGRHGPEASALGCGFKGRAPSEK